MEDRDRIYEAWKVPTWCSSPPVWVVGPAPRSPGGRRGGQGTRYPDRGRRDKPFSFEGGKRLRIAEEGIRQAVGARGLADHHPNEKLLSVLGKTTSLLDAFKAANDVLLNAVRVSPS